MAKKIFAVKKTSKLARTRWLLTATVLGIFIIGTGFFLLQYKKSLDSHFIANYFSKMKVWIVAHKTHLKSDIAKVKHFAENKNQNEPEVNFEFYTSLPNMQVAVPAPAEQNVKPQPVKEIAKKAPKNDLLRKSFDAKTLEQDFSKHLSKAN